MKLTNRTSFHRKILIVFADNIGLTIISDLLRFQHISFLFFVLFCFSFSKVEGGIIPSVRYERLMDFMLTTTPTFRIFMYLSRNLFTNLFSKDLFTMSPSTLKYNNIEGSSFTDFSNSWICSTKFSAVKYPTNKLPRGRFTNSPYILSEIVNKSIIFSYLQRSTFFKLKSE